ncbi:MAG: hypothetical protein Fur0042_04590 [Cyanophyceae cyanobacterium]
MTIPPFRINLADGSVSFSYPPEAAQDLRQHLGDLVQRLKQAATTATSGDRPTPQPSMDYRYTGDIFLEIFCNPNIWPSPFAARVLVTLRDDRIRLSTEAELSRLIEDVNQYIDETSPQ